LSKNSRIVLLADERDILHFTASPDLRVFEYLKKTTRSTAVIFEQAIGLAEKLVGSTGSIGIRICKEPFCRNLLKRFRKPLVFTSANITG
jgi:L-threonylcarbamoyladenylate synthase